MIKSIDDCMAEISKEISPSEQIRFSHFPKDELVLYHHTFGRWVRNHFKLWEDNDFTSHLKSLGFRHPDDMSTALLKEFWNRMNLLPSEILKDGEKSQYFYGDKEVKNG
jgi:Ca2+-binding EF-hand superfamily protein